MNIKVCKDKPSLAPALLSGTSPTRGRVVQYASDSLPPARVIMSFYIDGD